MVCCAWQQIGRRAALDRVEPVSRKKPGQDSVARRLNGERLAQVFGEARLELHRDSTTTLERWPAVNQYLLQVAAFNRAVQAGGGYACPLGFSRGTQVALDAAFASAGPPPAA